MHGAKVKIKVGLLPLCSPVETEKRTEYHDKHFVFHKRVNSGVVLWFPHRAYAAN